MIFKTVKRAVGERRKGRDNYDSRSVDGGSFSWRKGAEAEEGRKLRGAALSEAGVDLDIFTPELAEADADAMLAELLPEALKAGYVAGDGFDGFNPQNLTKTGGVPKNVMEADIVSDKPGDRSLIAHIKYMADGKVNMAEFHIWRSGRRLSFWVRRDTGSYTIKCIECYWADKDFRKPLYHEKHSDGKDPREVLAEAFGELIA